MKEVLFPTTDTYLIFALLVVDIDNWYVVVSEERDHSVSSKRRCFSVISLWLYKSSDFSLNIS